MVRFVGRFIIFTYKKNHHLVLNICQCFLLVLKLVDGEIKCGSISKQN